MQRALLAILMAGSACASLAAPPASSASAHIYTCVDSQGRRHTSDRPIRECLDRPQRILNRDGSTRHFVGPSMSAEERAAMEARERERQAERAKQIDDGRRDRLLLSRYPDEEEHLKAREAALATTQGAILNSKQRLAELARERESLQTESEFYRGKPLPAKLQQALELNEVATEAQNALIENQRAEAQRIHALFDQELARLRLLWAASKPQQPTAAAPAAAEGR